MFPAVTFFAVGCPGSRRSSPEYRYPEQRSWQEYNCTELRQSFMISFATVATYGSIFSLCIEILSLMATSLSLLYSIQAIRPTGFLEELVETIQKPFSLIRDSSLEGGSLDSLTLAGAFCVLCVSFHFCAWHLRDGWLSHLFKLPCLRLWPPVPLGSYCFSGWNAWSGLRLL